MYYVAFEYYSEFNQLEGEWITKIDEFSTFEDAEARLNAIIEDAKYGDERPIVDQVLLTHNPIIDYII